MTSREAEGRLELLQIYKLIQCIHENDKEQIESLLEYGANDLINLTEPKDGTGVLHVAVAANNQELVSFLLSHGAVPNVQNKKGMTPVMMASELGNEAIVALLAQHHADMTLLDSEGKGVLFYCIYPTKAHTRCLQTAMKHQADANNVSASGSHVFQLMCENALECTPKCLLMLEGGADPNAANEKTGATALMEAAKVGSLQLVRSILRRGGNPNAIDKKRHTAVHYAAMGGFFEVIKVLSAYKADMGVVSLEDCTALHFAAATGDANCCKFLAQRGCNPKLKNLEGLLPRQIAKDLGAKAAAKELRKAEKLFGKGNKASAVGLLSDPWALSLHDWSNIYETELRQAFGSQDILPLDRFITVLEEVRAPVEIIQLHKVVSMHDKAKLGFININDFIKGSKYIKKPYLLSTYLPKKKKEKGGKGGKKKAKFVLPMPICTLTPELKPRRPDGGPPQFMIETYRDCSDINRFDKDHPPIHPIVNDSGWYLEKPDKVFINVSYCVKSGDLESLDLAFSQGVSVNVQDEFYKTPLMIACQNGSYEMVQYLLNRGADVNACDQFFWTPLHHAAHAGHVDIIELLLNAGASIDARALSGGTPLMRAIQSSRPASVEYLIKAGASVMAENKKEQDCLDIAKAFADIRVIDMVNAKVESLPKPKDGKKPKGKAKSQKAKAKLFSSEVAGASTATAENIAPPKELNSAVHENTLITTGKANTVDITFVPKTVWGEPPSTSQLMSQIEKHKKPLSVEMDFEDYLPFSQSVKRRTVELPKATN
ncbi:ankyrin repeat and EF-hand domain-containing protein 1a [Periophthalmus magnuspinnatus]|uniref:ankyrin repeat and EF-hand domain-containing protein 1a n=1 Tax=Periophthalmus magnuspinnatus TaxID=409849 RepID=UPI002436EE88|nr:ankyrin repeat and EF-hand domain-containing protein 1a [Periophthalmus magnuspinnatus]